MSRTVLAHVASRWSPAILLQLQGGEKRYSQLRSRIGGVSEKMLAQTLRELERDGLVLRTSYPVLPPHVVYALTGLGEACADRVTALVHWLDENVHALERARRSYQAKAVACDAECNAALDRARRIGSAVAMRARATITAAKPMVNDVRAAMIPASSGGTL